MIKTPPKTPIDAIAPSSWPSPSGSAPPRAV